MGGIPGTISSPMLHHNNFLLITAPENKGLQPCFHRANKNGHASCLEPLQALRVQAQEPANAVQAPRTR